MGPIAIAWLLSAGGIISLLSYALKDLPSFLKWIVIGCSIAAAVAMGPTGVCLLGAISVGLALLQYFNLIPSSVSDALNKFASWVTDAFDWFTGLFKSKPDAESPEAKQTNGVFFLLCLVAAVVVVIMIWFVLKDIPVLKWVISGCIVIAVALKLIQVSHHGGQG